MSLRSSFKTCPFCAGRGKVLDDRAIGQAMRDKRKKAGLTGCEMAKRLGLSPTLICDLERGRRRWNAQRQRQYLEAIK